MSKDAYFEMCDQLGQDPIDEDIPLDYSDFPYLVQLSFLVYSKLRDNWDPMGGKYLGKDYALIFKLFDLYQIDDHEEKLLVTNFLQQIDNIRIKIISEKISAETSASKNKKPR